MNSDPNTPSEASIAPPRPTAGQMFKQFRLESPLGEGGMGQVYRAYDSRLHRRVALKLLSAEFTSDPQRKQRFFQEARAAARINHPAVAQIFDADEQGGFTFIVMELVEGKTVQQLIQDKELDLLGSMDIGVQVADGLAKAHELGIVHRDIKPANVMRTAEGHVKILDFGLAKLVDFGYPAGSGMTSASVPDVLAKTSSGVVMGTPAYMSPEQVRGLPVDMRSDIFAFGVLMFEMVTGQAPFRRDNLMAALYAAGFEEAPAMETLRPGIPDPLQRIVSRCLKKQPEDRFPNARVVASELRSLRRDTEAGRAPKTSWHQRALDAWDDLRQMPRQRLAWYGVGLAVAALALYWSVSNISFGGVLMLGVLVLAVYRRVRNQPQRLEASLVRKVSKIPEVRIISAHERQLTVVIDRPVAQLYGRIQGHLATSNKKRYFGQPMTLTIQHDLSWEQTQKLLASPGVQYVREDVVKAG